MKFRPFSRKHNIMNLRNIWLQVLLVECSGGFNMQTRL